MAKGYHSRSPEEFRDYLQNIKKEKQSTFWKQFIIFVDIIIIMIVFFLVHRMINPGTSNQGENSIIQSFNYHRLRLTVSTLQKMEGALLYLIVDNNTGSISEYPSTWSIKYSWLTENNEVCSENNFLLLTNIRPIPPESSGMLELPISPPSIAPVDNQPDTCKVSYFRNKSRMGLGLFKKKFLYLTLVLEDSNKNKAEFRLAINPYP